MFTGLVMIGLLILVVIAYGIHSRRVEAFQGFPSDGMCYLGQIPVLFNSTGTQLRAYESVPSAEAWLGKQKVLEIIAAGNVMPVQCVAATVLYGKLFGSEKMPLAPPAAVAPTPTPTPVPATAAPPMAQIAPAVPTSAPAPAALPAPARRARRAPRAQRAPPRPAPRTRATAPQGRRTSQMGK